MIDRQPTLCEWGKKIILLGLLVIVGLAGLAAYSSGSKSSWREQTMGAI